MKKVWISPEMYNLSVEHTEAQKTPNGIHDGVIYDGVPGWEDGVEGHS
jgi:hypothetical protein